MARIAGRFTGPVGVSWGEVSKLGLRRLCPSNINVGPLRVRKSGMGHGQCESTSMENW